MISLSRYVVAVNAPFAARPLLRTGKADDQHASSSCGVLVACDVCACWRVNVARRGQGLALQRLGSSLRTNLAEVGVWLSPASPTKAQGSTVDISWRYVVLRMFCRLCPRSSAT